MGYPAQIKGIGQYTLSNIASALITYPVTALPGDYVVIIAVTGGPTSITNNYTLTNPSGWTKYGHISYRYIQSPENSVIIATGDGNAINITWVVIVLRPSETVQGPVWYTAQSVNGVTQLAWAERASNFRSRRLILFGAAVARQPNSIGLSAATYAGSGYTGGTYNRGLMVGYIDLLPNAPVTGLWSFGAPTDVTPDYIGFITEEIVYGAATVSPSSSVTAAGTVVPWSAAVTIAPQASVTARTPRVLQFGVGASYVASTDGTDAGSVAACRAGGTLRALLRFPVYGEYPPLARVTKVELAGTVVAAGTGQWQIRPYRSGGSFADPEEDPFATQYANAVAAAPYLTTAAFATPGPFTVDLGAQAAADLTTLNTPEYGYVPLAIIGTDGATVAEMTNMALLIHYDVPALPPRPLHEVATVSLLTSDVPPRPLELDLAEYAARFEVHWQRPGAFELTVPLGSRAAAKLTEMAHVHLTVHGVPIATGFLETWSLRRTRETGTGGVLVTVGGQTLHRVLANRITGPFPAGFDFTEQTSFVAKGADAEVWTAGDPSPRGVAFGPASSSAESVLRKLLMAHTVQAPASRRTRWVDNLSFAPDDRRGVTGVVVSTSLQPLLAEAEKICHKADCGYAVVLDARGRYRVFYLPGVDRTAERGRWSLNAELTRGVEEVEVRKDLTELVTHVVVAASGQGATRNLALFRQPGGLEERLDRREAAIDAQSATTAAAAQLVGEAYLAQHGYRRSVTLSLSNLLEAGWLTAWQVGDKLAVEDPLTGVVETVRVYGVEVTLGTEQLVRALMDAPSMAPELLAALDHDSTKDGDFVAVASVLTAPTPVGTAGTWKETSPSALA